MRQILRVHCQHEIRERYEIQVNSPAASEAVDDALLSELSELSEPVSDDEPVSDAELPEPVVLPALPLAGEEESVALLRAVATPVGVPPLT